MNTELLSRVLHTMQKMFKYCFAKLSAIFTDRPVVKKKHVRRHHFSNFHLYDMHTPFSSGISHDDTLPLSHRLSPDKLRVFSEQNEFFIRPSWNRPSSCVSPSTLGSYVLLPLSVVSFRLIASSSELSQRPFPQPHQRE